MKMLMIIVPESRRDEIRGIVNEHGVHSYSEFKHVTGEGATGKRLGSRIGLEESAIVFTVVPGDKTQELLAVLREFRKMLFPDEGLRAFVLPVEEAI